MNETGEKMYVDVLLFENFIINYFILKITSKFSKLKTTRIKLAIGAIIGALYIFIVFFPSLKIFFTISMKIAVSILMITVAFTPEKFRDFFRLLGIFYIVSCAFGGAAFALFYFMGRGNTSNGAFYIKDFPVSLLVTAFALGYLLLNYCWSYVQKRVVSENLIYKVIVQLDDRQAEFDGILDTGNSLKDPITSFPVIVVEYEVLQCILPEKLSDVFGCSGQDVDLVKLYELVDASGLTLRMRLIPFSSLGKQNGMLIGIKPDAVKLNSNNSSKEVKDVIVGIYNNKISKNGEYRALLCPEIIN